MTAAMPKLCGVSTQTVVVSTGFADDEPPSISNVDYKIIKSSVI